MHRHTTDSQQRQRVIVVAAISALNLIGFGVLVALVVPQHLALAGGGVFGISLGLTAWSLGARHAFDADHVAAIDSTTRKLLGDGRDGATAGFFFSLGHSTIVFALVALVALGASGLAGALTDDDSVLGTVTGVWGTFVAGSFLLLVGGLNFASMRRLARAGRRRAADEITEAEFEHELEHRGLMNRLYRRFGGAVSAPWQLYPVGLLFGLGFDTVSEVALLVLAGGAAATGLPFYAVMCLPVLFAAGMTLLDTLNSAAASRAYRWALDDPERRVAYNLATTGITAFSAIAIGVLTLLGTELTWIGFAMAAVITAAWLIAAASTRLGGARTG